MNGLGIKQINFGLSPGYVGPASFSFLQSLLPTRSARQSCSPIDSLRSDVVQRAGVFWWGGMRCIQLNDVKTGVVDSAKFLGLLFEINE